jgi:HK97 gp10 family phage protein
VKLDARIEGLDDFLRKLKPEQLLEPFKTLLLKSAISIEGESKLNAPVDTGRLRASITHDMDASALPLWAKVGTNVEYAPYQEFGTSKMAAHPYLGPALESKRGAIQRFAKEAMDAIAAMWGK